MSNDLGGDQEVGLDALMKRMKNLAEHRQEFSAEEQTKRYEHVESQSAELGVVSSAEDAARPKPEISQFIDEPDFTYQDFARRGSVNLIPTFRVQDYSWDDHAFSLINRLYNDVGNLLDDKFRLMYQLTYNFMGSKKDVDTSRFRTAIWNYIQCMFGIRHDDYDYGEVNQVLERSLKAYIKTAVCFPERVTRTDYDNVLKELHHSEKIMTQLVLIYYYIDERLLEYDVDHVVADVQSTFQHIQIFHTINFGNLLVLDDLQNLAESDLVYTETLIQRGKIDYTGKDVLILGAGDGALLWELLKENPNMVTMVEIDETVMKLCSEHLRSACGSALDSLSGPHHQIVIGDCLVELEKLKNQNVEFDFVFSDLTDIPLSTTPQNKEWQFLLDVMEKSLSVLKPNGKFLTHGSGVSSVQSLANFELHLKNLQPRVEFKRVQSFVPSFMEDWVFYQVWKV
nr:EOG090X07PL [Megafenestra aurita]